MIGVAFPEEFSVGRDLREIKAELRRLRRAKQAGRTSMGPGDGAMEVRNAAGQPIAMVGHSGSAGGLLVRNRENTAWVSLADERSRIDGRVDSVWTSVDSHHARISANEGHVARIDGRIDSVWNSIDSHASRLSSAESALSSAAGTIAALTNYNVQLAAYLNNLRTWLIDNVGGTPPIRPNPL